MKNIKNEYYIIASHYKKNSKKSSNGSNNSDKNFLNLKKNLITHQNAFDNKREGKTMKYVSGTGIFFGCLPFICALLPGAAALSPFSIGFAISVIGLSCIGLAIGYWKQKNEKSCLKYSRNKIKSFKAWIKNKFTKK